MHYIAMSSYTYSSPLNPELWKPKKLRRVRQVQEQSAHFPPTCAQRPSITMVKSTHLPLLSPSFPLPSPPLPSPLLSPSFPPPPTHWKTFWLRCLLVADTAAGRGTSMPTFTMESELHSLSPARVTTSPHPSPISVTYEKVGGGGG